MNNDERTARYRRKVNEAREILREITERRNISIRGASKSLCTIWNITEGSTRSAILELEEPEYWALTAIYDKNPITEKMQDRVRKGSQRMSDYLHYCGFSDEHAQAIMGRLNALNRNIQWQEPDERIKPYQPPKQQPLEDIARNRRRD